MNKSISILALVMALMVGCGTLIDNTYKATGVSTSAVDKLMKVWADMSVKGQTSPEIDARVFKLHDAYLNSLKLERDAIRLYFNNKSDQQHVDAAIRIAAKSQSDLIAFLNAVGVK